MNKYPAPVVGSRYGMLTVLYPDLRPKGQRERYCWVRCDCGMEKMTIFSMLLTGRTKSCGCFRLQQTKQMGLRNVRHGVTRNYQRISEWNIWASMRQRCQNPSHAAYARYGGRGIKVCKRWDVFENFLADMGVRQSRDLSIDRIDPDGDYEPSNCRWATKLQQRHNRSRRPGVRP